MWARKHVLRRLLGFSAQAAALLGVRQHSILQRRVPKIALEAP